MPHSVVAEELALLERVTASLEEVPATRGPSEASILKEVERLRDTLAAGEESKDAASLTDQLYTHTALLRQIRESRQTPHVERGTPYFAHLRLEENGETWDVCLGKATHIVGDVRIIDWRNAPISQIFYRYQQGDFYDEEIAGRERFGRVVARRTVTIRNGRLGRVEAPEGTFVSDRNAPGGWRELRVERPRLAGGEGAALRAYEDDRVRRRLGTDDSGIRMRADKHLPDIAGLIDSEQFALITRPSSGLVVVRGTAGSGKTTVALHRIAYLAYDEPLIDSPRTLVLVFSVALRNYVSHVLPALGVHRVQVRTFHEWAREQFQRLFPMLPRTIREDTPSVVHRLKVHPAMMTILAEQVRRTEGSTTVRQVVDDWGSALSQGSFLADTLARVAPGAFTAEEVQRAAAWCGRKHEQLIAWLNGDKDNDAQLDAEDHALLLRAWQLRVGPLPVSENQPLRYQHVVIDEVQDFSPLEVRVVFDCLDERRSMTLAGDTQQHIMAEAGFTSWEEFFDHLGIAGTTVDTLRVSYRSTREIVSFAQHVLGPLREDDEPPMATRSGPPVEMFRFTDHGACVGFLTDALKDLARKEPLASVAVLTPSRSVSAEYARAFERAEVPNFRWVRDQDFAFTPGVELTEIEQVKGLEFDYVILVEVSTTHFPDVPSARRLLHVGATRAVHQLWLTTVGTPSPLVREVLQLDVDGHVEDPSC